MKKIKTLSVGLSVLFLLSCENKQDTNKPEKPKVETEKTSTDNPEKSHENHLQKQIVSLIDGIQKGKPDEVKTYFDFSIKKHYSSVIIGITIDLCQWYFTNLLLFRSFFHFFFDVFYAVL